VPNPHPLTEVLGDEQGWQASARLAVDLAGRMKSYGIVPEYSFVLDRHRIHWAIMAGPSNHREIKQVNRRMKSCVHLHTGAMRRHECIRKLAAWLCLILQTLDEWASTSGGSDDAAAATTFLWNDTAYAVAFGISNACSTRSIRQ